MFEIGFWELVLISVIALFVFGPERLPDAIRTVSRNIRSVRNMMNNVKTELTKEISIQEARELPEVKMVHPSGDSLPENSLTGERPVIQNEANRDEIKAVSHHL